MIASLIPVPQVLPVGKKKPKPKPPDPEPKPVPESPEPEPGPTSTARLDTELLEWARIVCAHTKERGRQLKLVDFLDRIFRPVITREYQAVMERIRKEEAKKGGGS